MRLIENRPVAWAVLAICIVGSIIGLGGGSLVRERDHVMDVFFNGTEKQETARYSMDAYLDRAAECAMVMAGEVQLHLGGDHPAAASAMEALSFFGDDDDLDERYEAYVRLQQDSDAMYNAMYSAQLTDQQRVNFKRAYDDFWGSDKYIRKDTYRELASEFNAGLKGFPAGLIADIMGVDALNSFGG